MSVRTYELTVPVNRVVYSDPHDEPSLKALLVLRNARAILLRDYS